MRKNFIKNSLTSGVCCWEECGEEGKYPAPKSPERLKDRYYFCLQHVREYNKSWNFFHKMGDEELSHFHKESITGHRPTWKFGVSNKYNVDDIKKQVFGQFFHGHYTRHYRTPEENEAMRLPKHLRDALKVMGLKYPVSLEDIKRRYKELAKTHHPDITGKPNQERIKAINQAYSVLKSEGSF